MAEAAPLRYSSPTRLLHWLVALMVFATLPIGGIMLQDGLPRPTQNLLFIIHKNGGVILFVLVLLRLLFRALGPSPAMPATMPALQVMVARAAHVALYAALLAMASSGYVRVTAGGFPVELLDWLGVPPLVPRSDALAETAKGFHANARFVLIALILAHVGAALHHALIRKDGLFTRIWPPLGGGRE